MSNKPAGHQKCEDRSLTGLAYYDNAVSLYVIAPNVIYLVYMCVVCVYVCVRVYVDPWMRGWIFCEPTSACNMDTYFYQYI